MKYNVMTRGDKVIIRKMKHFEPKHIFECGQCFRWDKEADDSYTGVAHGKILNVRKDGENIIFSNTSLDDFNDIWVDYFDLKNDYGEIKDKLSDDPTLKEAIKFGYGIRILKQDEWEMLISFIMSARNSIPMIKRSINILSERYGKYIGEYNGKNYYSFPEADVLAQLSLEDIQDCKTSFRAKYIANAAAIVSGGDIDIYRIKNLSTKDARKELMRFAGVGPKVSDCIMLFSMNKYDAFPIDVWVKRVMEYFYLKQDTSLKIIQEYGQNKFRDYAGYAQQYLFYYARELGIGK
ncbi:DNA glycosylase [Proteiniborus sp. MB09-C3]|uniref:DNA-3-methyladenine glycosylase family protein n=1 Tax=Proteiniborus sp. MB09-C3 TaxID=3050072 RepID=UPI0025548A94|nr:DNA glycosylase [Proteiniborus sp. MB09-C3]WIV11960.1 DNA glycosylase [Proteiniborus sp. MB09-C3]